MTVSKKLCAYQRRLARVLARTLRDLARTRVGDKLCQWLVPGVCPSLSVVPPLCGACPALARRLRGPCADFWRAKRTLLSSPYQVADLSSNKPNPSDSKLTRRPERACATGLARVLARSLRELARTFLCTPCAILARPCAVCVFVPRPVPCIRRG